MSGRWQPAVDLVEAASGPHRGQRRGQPLAGHRMMVDVAAGDDVDSGRDRQFGHGRRCGPNRSAGRDPTTRRRRSNARSRRPTDRAPGGPAAGPVGHRRRAGTGPLRQAVRTTASDRRCRRRPVRRGVRRGCGAPPFSPASWPSLMARAEPGVALADRGRARAGAGTPDRRDLVGCRQQSWRTAPSGWGDAPAPPSVWRGPPDSPAATTTSARPRRSSAARPPWPPRRTGPPRRSRCDR